LILTNVFFSIEYLDISDMTTMCQKCGALVWYGERSEKKFIAAIPTVSVLYEGK
jgi:hypothetical protein